ncbi:MAG: Gfo/Idh/MocA family oxidoreductase, partial [Phycisphaerae bacterium]|nr:Gfo/Idh/MocA family oxidoreductase [Phycisphaerae bacterium]
MVAAKPGRLVAVCDLAAPIARKLAEQYGAAEVFTDFGEALKKTSANAVYLATPVFLHAPQAAMALQAGKHVLVEKPLGLNRRDVDQALQAAGG